MRLDRKVAIVTGASRGLGRSIAQSLASSGADVVLADLRSTLPDLGRVGSDIERCGRRVLVFETDVTVRDDVDRMTEATLRALGKIDILVNNAGVFQVCPFEDIPPDQWDRTLAVNLTGVFNCSQVAAKVMIDQGRGKIINISSVQGELAWPGRAAYAASKAGVIMLTKVMSIELAKYNICVNAVAPGLIRTEHFDADVALGRVDQEPLIGRIPLGRLGKPEDVASAVLFLASDHSDYITGESILVDGGWAAYGYT